MEKNSQTKMSSCKINWSNIHANSMFSRSAISQRFYGAAFKSIKSISGQYVENRRDSKK